MSDDKDPPHKGDCRTHSGMAINMTSAVHCCKCWRSSDFATLDQIKLQMAVNILQTTTIKTDPSYQAASAYLVRQFNAQNEQ